MSFSQILIDFILKFIEPSFYFVKNNKIVNHKVNNSTKFKVRIGTSDRFIVWEVWKYKEYADDKYFTIGSSDVVVDIGAHIGSFSVYAAKMAPKGHVYAYEPAKNNYNLLVENIKLNKIDNISAFNIAILNKKDKINLFIAKENPGGTSIYKNIWSKKRVIVPTITLKDIFTRNRLKKIDFLKLDAEGAEYKILLNSQPEILKKIDKMVIEFHDFLHTGHTYGELKLYLEKNGFHVTSTTPWIVRGLLKIGILKAKRLPYRI